MHHNLKGLLRTAEPSTPIISTSDAKTFLRVDTSDEDTLIALWVEAATRQVEDFLRRALITQTWTLTLDRFSNQEFDEQEIYGPGVHDVPRLVITAQDFIHIPRLPIQTVTSVTTFDTANSSSVFSSGDYTLDTVNGRIYLDTGSIWPTDLRDTAAIIIVYVAGYGDAATDVPAPIRQAIYDQLRRIYEARGDCGLSDAACRDLAGFRLVDYLGFG